MAREFYDLLEGTSRSFFLGIQGLKQPSRDVVCYGYLFCRLLDIFEDASEVPLSFREEGLELLGQYLKALPGHTQGREEAQKFHRFSEDQQTTFDVYLQRSSKEKELYLKGHQLLGAISEMPCLYRSIFCETLYEMKQGMQAAIAKGPGCKNFEELEDYCYFVAGTVGNFLTRIFWEQGAFKAEQKLESLLPLGVSFGKALQVVNITKDFFGDWQDQRVYWPDVGLPLEKASNDFPDQKILENRLESLGKMFRGFEAEAALYVDAISLEHKDVRFFCQFPLEMAKENMRIATQSLEWLSEHKNPKVSKPWTLALLAKLKTGIS